jgi:hypothetical protein
MPIGRNNVSSSTFDEIFGSSNILAAIVMGMSRPSIIR